MLRDGLASHLRSLLGLNEIRSLLRTRRSRGLVAAIAAVYAVISLVAGGMIQFFATGSPFGVQVTPIAQTADWWNYPRVLVTSPSWVLYLPFLPTATMVLVSLGVGIALGASGILLAASLRRLPVRRTRFGLTSGAAPAVAGLATLGACCCTSCTATLSVGVIASVSGSDLYTLLQNNWYLDLFQLAVVGLSLVALERGLRNANNACLPTAPVSARFLAGTTLRIALLLAAMTWSLAMFVEWGEVSPWSASVAQWYHWIFEHQLLSLAALLAALFPADASRAVARWGSTTQGRIVRIALFVSGFTWAAWVPGAAVGWGLGGFLNELFGVLGLPASAGAASVDAVLGAALAFHWGFQHLLLGAFAMLLAVRPQAALAPMTWTIGAGTFAAMTKAPEPSA